MDSKFFLFPVVCVALLLHKSVLSDHGPSISILENEIRELKVQVEDLSSKVEFLLRAHLSQGRPHIPQRWENEQLSKNQLLEMERDDSPFIIERLQEVERILTDAPEDIGPQIYFASEGGGVNVFSDVSNDIRTVVSSTEDIEGMAYDPVHDRIYYCSWETIYRTNRQGNEVEIVFHDSNADYYEIFGLAVDWITGNLYGASRLAGKIFVCSTASSLPLNCTTILNSAYAIHGIAISPNDGEMYWTDLGGNVMKAEMDGSNPVQVVSGLIRPSGLVLDNGSSRLFWADYHGRRIQSSTLAGEDVKTIVQLSETFLPWGVALYGNKIYWGSRDPPLLQSSTKDGDNIHTLYTARNPIQHLTLTTRNPTRTRNNACEGHRCPKMCVLTSTAHRCLS